MATTVTERVLVRRPVAEVLPHATDPDVILPLMGGLGRFEKLVEREDGSEEWDVFLDIGTLHVGGRVEVPPSDGTGLTWHSLRGTRHRVRLGVSDHPEGALVTLAITVEFVGLVTGPLTELLSRGILHRHLRAGLEQLRHHLEHGRGPGGGPAGA